MARPPDRNRFAKRRSQIITFCSKGRVANEPRFEKVRFLGIFAASPFYVITYCPSVPNRRLANRIPGNPWGHRVYEPNMLRHMLAVDLRPNCLMRACPGRAITRFHPAPGRHTDRRNTHGELPSVPSTGAGTCWEASPSSNQFDANSGLSLRHEPPCAKTRSERNRAPDTPWIAMASRVWKNDPRWKALNGIQQPGRAYPMRRRISTGATSTPPCDSSA